MEFESPGEFQCVGARPVVVEVVSALAFNRSRRAQLLSVGAEDVRLVRDDARRSARAKRRRPARSRRFSLALRRVASVWSKNSAKPVLLPVADGSVTVSNHPL